jgi:two-component system, OmpR family, KDP operon response regulator KdpE
MNKKSILVVDDDLLVVKYLRANLQTEGYQVHAALDGNEALEMLEKELPDLVILDINMPIMDGYEVCRRIRQWSQVPILILSVLAGEEDKVKCLDSGADDYLVKPFGVSELTARVRALFRRTEPAQTTPENPTFIYEDLEVYFSHRKVYAGKKEVNLTQTEYHLLTELVLNAGKVLTHTYLLAKVWGPEYVQESQYLHVYIQRLRRKIENDSSSPQYILTVQGVGYQFTSPLMN